MAGQPIIGFNYGARNYGRVRHALEISLIVASAISVLSWVAIEVFPQPVIKLFVKDSPEIMGYGIDGLRTFLFALPVVGFQIVVGNYFQSVGKAGRAVFLSLLRQVIILIPLLLILPHTLGVTGVWISAPIADTVSAIICVIVIGLEWKRLKKVAT
jgi:Na+-driven multidrug efflux pump